MFCPNGAAVGTCWWWEARWGPAAALSSFAAVGFPTTAIPVHREAIIAADLITARLQNREARLGAQTPTSFALRHYSTSCTPEGASCSVPIQSRVRLPWELSLSCLQGLHPICYCLKILITYRQQIKYIITSTYL